MIREQHPDKSREELKKEVMELFSRVRIPDRKNGTTHFLMNFQAVCVSVS